MRTTINTTNRKISVFKILIISFILISSGKIHGQSENEVSVHLKGLFSTLQFEGGHDSQTLGNGLGVGLNYNYYFTNNWSVGTGVEFQTFEGSITYNSISDAYQTADIEGENFEFRYEVQKFWEEQSAYYLNIPVKIQYETTGQFRFYAAGGAKIGFNVKSRYESELSSLKTTGYYEQYDVELNSPMFMGFGEFTDLKSGEKSLNLNTIYMINFETGVKFLLEKNRAFYMGLFFDYGINDIRENNSQQNLITYNPEDPTSFEAVSVFSSTNRTGSEEYVNIARTVAFGLKIRYAFGL